MCIGPTDVLCIGAQPWCGSKKETDNSPSPLLPNTDNSPFYTQEPYLRGQRPRHLVCTSVSVLPNGHLCEPPYWASVSPWTKQFMLHRRWYARSSMLVLEFRRWLLLSGKVRTRRECSVPQPSTCARASAKTANVVVVCAQGGSLRGPGLKNSPKNVFSRKTKKRLQLPERPSGRGSCGTLDASWGRNGAEVKKRSVTTD